MKKITVIFLILYLATLLLPAAALLQKSEKESEGGNEMVTIFNTGDYKTVQYFS